MELFDLWYAAFQSQMCTHTYVFNKSRSWFVDWTPTVSYRLLVLFKPHLRAFPVLPFPCFPLNVTSYLSQHDKTQDYLQSSWPLFDSGLVQDGA